MLKGTMDKVNVSIMCFMGRAVASESGENHTLSIIGWSAVALAVVLAIFVKLPGQAESFMDKIFNRLSNGLGL